MRKPSTSKPGSTPATKPGRGRPSSGRTAHISVRIKPEAKASFEAHAAANDLSLAEAVEEGARRLRPGENGGPAEEPCVIIISGARRRR